MAVSNRMDIQVLEEDLDALSDEVAKLGNSPDEQARKAIRTLDPNLGKVGN